MGWLTGKQVKEEVVKGRINITPFRVSQLNPNSYDYRLAPVLKILKNNSIKNFQECLDPKKKMIYQKILIPEDGYIMQPNTPYLGYTVEKFGSNYFASLCTGKSSIGRLFLQNHMCAGLIDQGFFGHITLEITVERPTVIYPNMRIGQIFWFESFGETLLYTGKYQNGNKGKPSLIYTDISK